MTKYIFVFFMLQIVSPLLAQNINFSFSYYEKYSTTKVGVSNTLIELTNSTTKQVFEETTDKTGRASFKLPAGYNYVARIPSHERTINLQLSHLQANAFSNFSYERIKQANQQRVIVSSTSSNKVIDFSFYYYDREQTGEEGVEGVEVVLTNPKTGQVFQAKTNKDGAAKFQLPIQHNYKIEVPLEDVVFDLNIAHLSANGSSRMSYKGYSLAYYKAEAIADSLYQIVSKRRERELDSILAVRAKQPGEVFFHFIQDLGDEYQFWMGKVYDNARAVDTTQSLGEDNAYTVNGTCSAVLQKRGKLTTKKKAGTYPFYAIALIDDKVYEWKGEYSLEGSQVKVVYLRATKAILIEMTKEEYYKL